MILIALLISQQNIHDQTLNHLISIPTFFENNFIVLARLIAIWFRTDKNNIMEQFFVVFLPRNTFMPKYFLIRVEESIHSSVFDLSKSHASSQKSFSHKYISYTKVITCPLWKELLQEISGKHYSPIILEYFLPFFYHYNNDM